MPERVRDLPNEPVSRPNVNLWPYALILVGLLLLLVNVGWISSSALWSLVGAWPIVLVAVGADLVTSGRYRVWVLGAALLALIVWLLAAPATGARVSERVTLAYPRLTTESATLQLRFGVGSVNVQANAAAGELLSGRVELLSGETLLQSLDRDGTHANVSLSVASASTRSSWGVGEGPSWDLALAPGVLWTLRANGGVGRVVLDLSDATLAGLHYAGGVGETLITLPSGGGYSVEADLGVGATTLQIPAGVEARLLVRTGIGSVNVHGDFDRSDNLYTTPGYARALPEARIDVRLNAGVGGVTVRRLR